MGRYRIPNPTFFVGIWKFEASHIGIRDPELQSSKFGIRNPELRGSKLETSNFGIWDPKAQVPKFGISISRDQLSELSRLLEASRKL